jgi:hypothetical protein
MMKNPVGHREKERKVTNRIRLTIGFLLALALTCAWGVRQASAAKAPKNPTATESEKIPAAERPGSGVKAPDALKTPLVQGSLKLPELDVYPWHIQRTGSGDDWYRVRVALKCESEAPVNIHVEVDLSNGTTPMSQKLGPLPCRPLQTFEFTLRGPRDQEWTATLDRYNKLRETNESNNTCEFSWDSFTHGDRYTCPSSLSKKR